MRLFLAIDLPQKTKELLAEQIYPFQKEYPAFDWVQTKNYHLTVHFFGETSKSIQIIEKTKHILFDQDPFYLYATNLDYFMTKHIMIYAHFRRERLLENLISKVRDAFGSGFQEAMTIVPHITIARCRISSKQQYFLLQKKIEKVDINIEFPVNEVILFESTILDKRPLYQKVARIPLAAKI